MSCFMFDDDKLILIGSLSPQIAESESILEIFIKIYSIHHYDILLKPIQFRQIIIAQKQFLDKFEPEVRRDAYATG